MKALGYGWGMGEMEARICFILFCFVQSLFGETEDQSCRRAQLRFHAERLGGVPDTRPDANRCYFLYIILEHEFQMRWNEDANGLSWGIEGLEWTKSL